jgi:hypothetical protein
MEQKEEIKWLVVCVYRCEYGEDEDEGVTRKKGKQSKGKKTFFLHLHSLIFYEHGPKS